jgi:hypothetical protein
VTPRDPDPFYIGYEPPMPRPIARVVTRAVALLFVAGLAGLFLLAAWHRAIAGGVFEFGSVKPVTGVVVERPYPAIRVDGRPASTLLVAAGKHGAAALVRGLDRRRVTVDGQRIARDGREMLEISAIRPSSTPESNPDPARNHGANPESTPESMTVLRGEIVDTKCYLGVMVPGQGKTHRACASLCLRGGIPPALLVEARDGATRLVLLAGPAGAPLDPATAADAAGEAIELRGRLSRTGG